MNAKLDENAPGGGADEDARLLEGAVFDQAAYDKLLAQGRIASAPMAVTSQRTDWNGLTPAQEREKEGERARQREILAEAEYQAEMAEIRERADRLDRELDNWERDLRRRQAQADANDIVLHDGRHALVGPNNTFTDKTSGQKLQGADEKEAREKKTGESTTEEKNKNNQAEWTALKKAKDDAREAKSLTSQDGKNLSSQEMSEKRKLLAEAEEIAKRQQRLEASVDNDSRLSNTDTLSALGGSEQQAARSPSYAATLEPKDSRSATLQDQFTLNAKGTNLSSDSIAAALSNTDTLSALGLDDKSTGLRQLFAANAQSVGPGTDGAATPPKETKSAVTPSAQRQIV